jgi:hypothetical protein
LDLPISRYAFLNLAFKFVNKTKEKQKLVLTLATGPARMSRLAHGRIPPDNADSGGPLARETETGEDEIDGTPVSRLVEPRSPA